MKRILIFPLALVLIFTGCSPTPDTLRIIHAGSLAVPVREAADSFERKNPGIRVLTEAWGSKAGARRISDLGLPCDVYISADYRVIDIFLIPEHASWNISFAGNEMAIVFTGRSRYSNEINADNWHEILMREDVVFGRSDPDSDPCGVRTVLLAELAGILYDKPELPANLLSRHRQMIRPKETDLIALLETNTLDYIFLYRSVAEQHKLKYTILPDELNLRDPQLNEWYAQACAVTQGKRPGETITERGEAMVYGITIPHNTRKPALATEFVRFFLSAAGQDIMERNGQKTLVPAASSSWEAIPPELREFALPAR